MNRSRDRSAGHEAVGCVVVLGFFAAVIGLPLYCGVKARNADDKLFSAARTPCRHKWSNGHIEITTAGLSAGCAVTEHITFKITNRLTDFPVTLCLGHRGDCMSGHPSPFPGNRLTIAPGRTVIAKFWEGRKYGMPLARNYPITLQPFQGLAFRNLDLTVRTEDPPAPAGG